MNKNLDFTKITNPNLAVAIKTNYFNNLEFQKIVDQLLNTGFDLAQFGQFHMILNKYFASYELCQNNNDKVCQQELQGFRFKLKLVNQNLFLVLTKCGHKKNKTSIANNYLHADFPENLIGADLKKAILYPNDKERMKLLHHFVELVHDWKTAKWLFLTGNLNVGKTFLTVWFSNTFISANEKKVIFINAMNLFLFFRKYIFAKNVDLNNFYQQLTEVDLLVIDDFGDETKLASFRDEFLLPILKKRQHKNLLTFFLANSPYEVLFKNWQLTNDNESLTKNRAFFHLLKNQCTFFTLSKIIKQ